jgi:hypothetical protein
MISRSDQEKEAVLYAGQVPRKEKYARFERGDKGLWVRKELVINRPVMLGLDKKRYSSSIEVYEKPLSTTFTAADSDGLGVLDEGIRFLFEILHSVREPMQKTPAKRRDYQTFCDWTREAWNKIPLV